MALHPGTRLGSYEVVAQIGVGGMGEVYRARDTKLNRDVALKVLPDSFANDPDRLARFTREAQTLASLNHPQIAAIYGIEDSDGVRALVMELVEGEDLSQLIAGRRQPAPAAVAPSESSSRGATASGGGAPRALSIDDALAIATQIAEALEAAHEQGIIHRDLKPANVKVRADGTVKVLDFGLAKAMDPTGGAASSASMSPTISLHATAAGVILGTAAYMAPEQAKGKSVDRRADVWAFGVVLYEMLTGKRAFAGEDVSDTLVSVLRDEPDWAALPADVPPSTRQVLRVCLQKDPKRRVRDMSAIRLALDGAFDLPAPVAVASLAGAPRRARWQQALPWVVAGAVVIGSLATGAALWLRPAPAVRVVRFTIATPPDLPMQAAATTPAVAISPDGSRVVYRVHAGIQTTVNGMLYRRDLGQLDTTLIRGTEGALGFSFSPDATSIVFSNSIDNTLKRVSVSGGPPQTICPLDGPLRGASWGLDNTIVFATTSSKGLRRVPATGGTPQMLTKVDSSGNASDHLWPEILSDGSGVIFVAWNGTPERSRIVALSFATGAISDVLGGGTQPRVAATGHLLFGVGDTLKAVRFNAATLKAEGDPAPVLEGVSAVISGGVSYALAKDGSLVYVTGSVALLKRTLVWVDRRGREEAINTPPRAYTYARLSPDGTRVALDARDEQNDIWIWDLRRETLQRLTTDPGMNRMPVWTPDSTRIAFTAASTGGAENIFWQRADGSGTPERLSLTTTTPAGPASFSRDGKQLVFDTPMAPPYDLGVLHLDGTRREELLLTTSFSDGNGALSLDGRWLAYESNESGRPEVYLVSFPDVKTAKRQVSTLGGTRPLWSKDGRELFYYVSPDTIMALPVRLGRELVLGKPQVVVKGPYAVAFNTGRHYDVSPDGQRFLLLKDQPPPDGQKVTAPEIRLVQHWDEELKAKVPAGK